jgi:hypothetical protein
MVAVDGIETLAYLFLYISGFGISGILEKYIPNENVALVLYVAIFAISFYIVTVTTS